MGDYKASFWGAEQDKIEKLRKQSTSNINTYNTVEIMPGIMLELFENYLMAV